MRCIGILVAFLYSGILFGQTYPSKPIRFIVSFPPGGSSDLMARALAPRLSERLGQQVVVENRAGAGGNLGVDAVAKAPADGYTIGLAAAGALSLNVSLYPTLPFDPQKDLAPISLLAMIPFVLIANAAAPFSDLREMLVLAKKKPGALAYGHGGNASAMHLSGELLKISAGIDLLPVPYKGSGPVAADVLGGQVPIGIVDLPSALANVRAGKLKALAVTSKARIAAAPEVPTFAEAGVPGYESVGWFGCVAPAGTAADIIRKLNTEIVRALSDPAMKERMIAAGAEPLSSTPQEFAAFIRDETAKWGAVIRTAKIKVD